MQKRLPPQSFKDLDSGLHVVNLIDTLFDEVYLVGGAVRDDILRKETRDLDFAVPNKVDDVVKTLTKAGFEVRENAAVFGTVGTNIGEYDVQITTYRTEEYTVASRHPKVTSIVDIDSDLARRDFTINSMALSKDEFIDPFDGFEDINSKLIRCVHDPIEKLKEDPLRILRAYRLVSTLGYNIEEQTLESIKKTYKNIAILSSERIGEEFKKLIKGDYWSDALYEVAESGALNECLSNLSVRYRVSEENIISVIDQYSQEQLKAMDEPHRWACFITILNIAERDAGTTTIDVDSTVESFGLKVLLPKATRNAVRTIIEELTAPAEELGERSKIEKLTDLFKQLSHEHSKRAPQVQAKLLTEKGKDLFYARQYVKALSYFEKALDLTDDGYNDTLKSPDSSGRQSRLRAIKSYYITRLSYILATNILADKLQAKFNSSDGLHRYIEKKLIKGSRLNSNDKGAVIDEALVIVYKEEPHDLALENFEDFISNPQRKIAPERIAFHLRSYLGKRLKDKTTTAIQRKRVYLQLSKIAKEQSGDQKLGLDYYDPYLDYLFNGVLSMRNLDKFWEAYDKLNEPTEQYITLTKIEGKEWYGRRRAHLNSAALLLHALSLATTLADKIYISKQIVEDYKSAGRAYEKNAHRFNIYYEWFVFLEWLKYKSDDEEDIRSTVEQLRTYDSFGYMDVDEGYFVSSLPELAKIRDTFIGLHSLLRSLMTQNKSETILPNMSEEINALFVLFKNNILQSNEVFLLIKNYLLGIADANVITTQMGIEDIAIVKENENVIEEMTKRGEGRTLEFKASWKFDVKKEHMGVSRNSDIAEDIIKTISAFMNTEGGTMLIGVRNDGEVCGLEETDFKFYTRSKTNNEKIDKIKLEIDNLFKERIGQHMQEFKEVQPEMYKGKTILKIDVKKSSKPVYCNNAIYTRGEAGSSPLTHSEFADYLAQHFIN